METPQEGTMYQLNPSLIAQKKIGRLFISDLGVGFSMEPGQSYDLAGLFGQDGVKQSRELVSAMQMGWVVPARAAAILIVTDSPPAPHARQPLPRKSVATRAQRAETLMGLAIRRKAVTVDDDGVHTFHLKSGKIYRNK